jgi:hypothetical protein
VARDANRSADGLAARLIFLCHFLAIAAERLTLLRWFLSESWQQVEVLAASACSSVCGRRVPFVPVTKGVGIPAQTETKRAPTGLRERGNVRLAGFVDLPVIVCSVGTGATAQPSIL